jgi:hypothetical protein
MFAGEVWTRILAAYEAGDLIAMCAWCRRVEIDGEWLFAPRAALTAIDAQNTLSHSICPGCAAALPLDGGEVQARTGTRRRRGC